MDDIESNPAAPVEKKAAGWGRRLIVGAVALVAVGTIGVAGALSQGFVGHGMGFGGHRFERILDAADATPEQEDKIWAIIDGTRSEVRPLLRDFRETREQLTEILAAPAIDKAAVEKLRAERIAAVDEASKKMTAAMVSAAEVLTPEQRAKLAEAVKDFGPRGRW